MQTIEINDSDYKSTICNNILRGLPDWFGVEASIVEYVEQVRSMPFYVVCDCETTVGFIAIKIHNSFTAEVCVMGALKQYHHGGVGTLLIEQAVKYCQLNGYKYLTVKTLADTVDYEPYTITRNFYSKMGFIPLEIFPLHWDEANPCLFMVKSV